MTRRLFASLGSGLALLVLVMAGIWVFRLQAGPSAPTSTQPRQQNTVAVSVEFSITPTPVPLPTNPQIVIPTQLPNLSPANLSEDTPNACINPPQIQIFAPAPDQVVPTNRPLQIAACAFAEGMGHLEVYVDDALFATLSIANAPTNAPLVSGIGVTHTANQFFIGSPFNPLDWFPTSLGLHSIHMVVYDAASGRVLMQSDRISFSVAEMPELVPGSVPGPTAPATPMPPRPITPDGTCAVQPTYAIFSPTQPIPAGSAQFAFGVSASYAAPCETVAHVVAFRLNPADSIPSCDVIATIPDNRPFWADQSPLPFGQHNFSRQFNLDGMLGIDRLFVRLQILQPGTNNLLLCTQQIYAEDATGVHAIQTSLVHPSPQHSTPAPTALPIGIVPPEVPQPFPTPIP